MPDGWAWSRLEPIASLITDYVANGSFASLKANVRTYKEKNYALFVRTVDFANNFKGDLSYIDKESYDFLEKSKLYGGELMLSNIGASIGKVFKVPHLDTPMSLAPNAIILRFFNDITCDYFEYVFKSFVGQNYLQFLSGGAAMPKFNKTDLRAMIVPVPPIKEQERIVESVKNTFIGIDDLDISYSGLANTIQSVKSKILDLAIRGKLVPQDPNDEPASVLLERIRAEKEELIKQGKIKRDKKESVIFKGDDNSYYEKIDGEVSCIDEEIPYNIPDTWTWVRLENCCVKEIRRGKSPKYAEISNVIVFAQKCNTKYNGIDISLAQYLDETTIKRYPTDEHMQDGDIVINSTGTGTLGRVGIYRNTDNTTGLLIVPDSHVTVIRSFSCISSYYLYAFMKAHQTELEKKGEGSTNQKELKPLTLKEMLIAVPPISEQKRINKSINVAFSHLAIIEKCLN